MDKLDLQTLEAIRLKDSNSIRFLESFSKNMIYLSALCESPRNSFSKLQARSDNLSFKTEELDCFHHKLKLKSKAELELSISLSSRGSFTSTESDNSVSDDTSKQNCAKIIAFTIFILMCLYLISFFVSSLDEV